MTEASFYVGRAYSMAPRRDIAKAKVYLNKVVAQSGPERENAHALLRTIMGGEWEKMKNLREKVSIYGRKWGIEWGNEREREIYVQCSVRIMSNNIKNQTWMKFMFMFSLFFFAYSLCFPFPSWNCFCLSESHMYFHINYKYWMHFHMPLFHRF